MYKRQLLGGALREGAGEQVDEHHERDLCLEVLAVVLVLIIGEPDDLVDLRVELVLPTHGDEDDMRSPLVGVIG